MCYASVDRDSWKTLALDETGHPVPMTNLASLPQLRQAQSFDSLVTVPFLFGGDWRGRLFLFNPSWRGERQEELRFLLDLVRQVGPAVYNVYLLHRLRRRASAAERARFARELHDGAVQSLIAVEMQVDVLRRQAEANRPIDGELGRIQSLLREEVLKLRELMQQMKAIDVDAQRLLGVLKDTVERFQRETGISARFVTDLDELDMRQRVCREFLRIVQEGLVNVRKHSGARHALGAFGIGRGRVEPDRGRRRKGLSFLRSLQCSTNQRNWKGTDDHSGTGGFDRRGTHCRIKSRTGNAPGDYCAEERGFAACILESHNRFAW